MVQSHGQFVDRWLYFLTVNDSKLILISDLVFVPAYLHKVYVWKWLNSRQLWTSDPKTLEKNRPSSSPSTTKRRSPVYSQTSSPQPTSTYIVYCFYRSVLRRFLTRVTTFGEKGGSTLSLAALVNSLNKHLHDGQEPTNSRLHISNCKALRLILGSSLWQGDTLSRLGFSRAEFDNAVVGASCSTYTPINVSTAWRAIAYSLLIPWNVV